MNFMRALLLPLLSAGLLMPLSASAAVFNPQTITLSNGMMVVAVTNRRAPVVSHMVWYRVGSADEPAGKSGIAHFLEHLMFKGTKTVPPSEFSKIVARNGGRDNAFTSRDFTAYFQKVARTKLELVMKMEADRMTNLVLTDAEVLPERDVVLEERRSRTENNPGARLWEATNATLFMNHPYRLPVIGWKHEIEKLNTEDAIRFYRRFYAPNNAILIVAGDITMAELKPLAEKYYGAVPRGPEIKRERISEPPHQTPRRVTLTDPQVGQPSLSRTYLAPSYTTATGKQAYALQVFAELFGGGARSRLYRSLVVEKRIAASAGAWYDPSALNLGTFGVSASPRPGTTLAQLEKAVDEEIRRLLADGVTDEEVARTTRSMATSAVYARDSISAAPNVIGRALTTGQKLADIEAWPERIKAVKPADVLAAAKSVLKLEKSVTGLLRPAGPKGR